MTETISSAETSSSGFKCEQCGKQFASLQAVAGHKLVHREQEPCPECGQVLTTPSARARHRKAEHGVPTKAAREKRVAAESKGDWNEDDILESVVSVMWPNGNVPATAIIPLIRWRQATAELIESIHTDTDMKKV